jgi:serine protease
MFSFQQAMHRPKMFLCLFMACITWLASYPARPTDPVPIQKEHLELREPHRLELAPLPHDFIEPGIEGLYAELRRGAEQDGNEETRPEKLVPYEPYKSPDTPPDESAFNLRQIVVKFAEGSAVRLRSGVLQRSEDPESLDTAARLSRFGLEPEHVTTDLLRLQRLVAATGGTIGRGVPAIEERDLFLLRKRAEANAHREMPDMNLFYYVHLPAMDPETVHKVLEELRRLRSVEVAYLQPIPFNATDILPVTTIDVTPAQNYFRAAPTGIDVDYARNFAAGRGGGVRIVDIESGWHFGHEDLPATSFGFGVNWVDSHGTAVLGELVAEDNGFGATGIAPNAEFGFSSVTSLDPFQPIYFYSVANAAMMSLRALRPGDVMVIEQHFQHAFTGFICSVATDPCGDCSIPPWVATEEFVQEHAAYQNITAVGVVVVEAAGNGRMPVTPASAADSGAIVVGAGDTALAPMCWSNFGPRVDLQGWGMSVGTLGYGPTPALQANGNDANQWYTNSFGGTSSATPIVAGAATLVQSIRANKGLAPLTSVGMRTLLSSTGTPQAAAPAGTTFRNIGPQPDLLRAIQSFMPDHARFVSQSAVPQQVAPGQTFAVSTTFLNAGGFPWTGNRRMDIVVNPGGFSGLPSNLGTASAPIQPEDSVSRTLFVTAPTQPGTYNLTIQVTAPQGVVLAMAPSRQIAVGTINVDNASVRVVAGPTTMQIGQLQPVVIEATNIGNTVWMPGTHVVALSRTLRAALPQTTVALSSAVPPGGVVTLSYLVGCSGAGLGYSSAQMRGPSGSFGQIVSRAINCVQ